MILRAGSAGASRNDPPWPGRVEYLARAAGMPGLGINLMVLAPGEKTSDRHWDSHSDEAMQVLEGRVTVIEDDGPHEIAAGDSAIWPAGVANGHFVENRSDSTARVLIVGTNPPQDIVHYPNRNRTRHVGRDGWRLLDGNGVLLDSGANP